MSAIVNFLSHLCILLFKNCNPGLVMTFEAWQKHITAPNQRDNCCAKESITLTKPWSDQSHQMLQEEDPNQLAKVTRARNHSRNRRRDAVIDFDQQGAHLRRQ